MSAPRAATVAGALLAALVAGFGASALPFYPEGWWAGIAALAGAAAYVRPRAGLAIALAAPVLPLGNHALGLAVLYAALAAAWLLAAWREPRFGLLFAVGPLLAPVGGLGLMPLAASPVRSTIRRGALAALGVLAAVVVAGLHGAPFPLTGEPPPVALGLAGATEPLAVARALWDVLSAHRELIVVALTLSIASAALPHVRLRGPWWIAGLGAFLLAATLLAAPAVSPLPVVAATWVTCAVVALAAPGEGFRDT